MKKTLNFISSKLLIIATLCIAFFATLLALPTQKTFAETSELPELFDVEFGDSLNGKTLYCKVQNLDDAFIGVEGASGYNFPINLDFSENCGVTATDNSVIYNNYKVVCIDNLNYIVFDFDDLLTKLNIVEDNYTIGYFNFLGLKYSETTVEEPTDEPTVLEDENKTLTDYIDDFGKGIKEFFDINDNVKNVTVGIIGIVVIAFILSRIFKRK